MKNKVVSLTVLAMTFLASCEGDLSGEVYKCETCVSAPEAKSDHDNTGRGIYKGAVLGSSGSIKFDIENTDATISAILTIDNVEYTLTTNDSYDNGAGFAGDFVGTMSSPGDISLSLSVSSTGFAAIEGTVTIPGHSDVQIELMKEKSDALVAIYEGTFSGTMQGLWNIALRVDVEGNGNWQGLMRPLINGNPADAVHFVGSIVVTELTGGGNGFEVTGNIIKDNIHGGWVETGQDEGGTWAGKRTL
jgi:hypothetical protein